MTESVSVRLALPEVNPTLTLDESSHLVSQPTASPAGHPRAVHPAAAQLQQPFYG